MALNIDGGNTTVISMHGVRWALDSSGESRRKLHKCLISVLST